MDRDDDYEVGYGKPPKRTRFRKGQSGNPKGRPKGAKDFTKLLGKILRSEVKLSERGVYKTVSSQEAVLLRLLEKALKGEPRAMDRFVSLAREHSAENEVRSTERGLAANEEAILERYQESILRGRKTGLETPSEEDDKDAE